MKVYFLGLKVRTTYSPLLFIHRYTSGTTHTSDALKYARETAFKTQNGMRPNAAKIAIVITDGNVTKDPRREKTCLRSFRPGPTQTRLFSHNRWLQS